VATNIKLTSIKQLLPISAPASVQIDFVVLGILPDLVQIYASGVSDQIGGFVDKVDINAPETHTERLSRWRRAPRSSSPCAHEP